MSTLNALYHGALATAKEVGFPEGQVKLVSYEIAKGQIAVGVEFQASRLYVMMDPRSPGRWEVRWDLPETDDRYEIAIFRGLLTLCRPYGHLGDALALVGAIIKAHEVREIVNMSNNHHNFEYNGSEV